MQGVAAFFDGLMAMGFRLSHVPEAEMSALRERVVEREAATGSVEGAFLATATRGKGEDEAEFEREGGRGGSSDLSRA